MLLDPGILLAYLAAATALVISPGPDTMFVLASSASGGARSGVAATLGISTGALAHATMAALGISALLVASPMAFDLLRVAGALYLLWIGIGAVRAFIAGLKGTTPAPPADAGERSSSSAYRRGLLTNLLNPKVGIFYIAFLPQFVNPGLGRVSLQIFLLGAIHNLIGTLWLIALSVVSGRAAEAFAGNRRVRAWLDGVAGGIYIVMASRMFLLNRPAAAGNYIGSALRLVLLERR